MDSGGTDLWESWARRWDRFQEAYVPGRELQFELIADCLALVRPADPLRILDLCCGPGSAGSRILRERPGAKVVAVDCDPWLLELGRRTAPGSIAWADADIGDPAWTERLPRRKFDAVVATTAMQWFTTDEVARIYRDVGSLLSPDGIFLTSDLVPAGSPSARRLTAAAHLRWRTRAVEAPLGEHWVDFWNGVRAEPSFAHLVEERDRRLAGRHPRPSRPFEFHEAALRAAGFADVDEVWRHHESAILLAQRKALGPESDTDPKHVRGLMEKHKAGAAHLRDK